MKRAICAVVVANSFSVQGAQAAFHQCGISTSTHHFSSSSRTTPRPSPRRQPQQSALYSTAESDDVMSAFDQAYAKLKAAAPATDPTENLQKKELALNTTTTTTTTTTTSVPQSSTRFTTSKPKPPPIKQAKEQLIPRPPRSDPPRDAFLRQQAAQQDQKNTIAAIASKRTSPATTATPLSAAPASAVSGITPDNSGAVLQKNQNKIKEKENLLRNTEEQTRQQRKETRLTNLDSADENKEQVAAQVATNLISSTGPPRQEGLSVNDKAITQEVNDRRVVSTIGGKMAVTKSSDSKFGIAQTVATWQSWIIGGWMGTVAVTPVLLLHHFYFYPEYESVAQWQLDTVVALIQGAVFAAVYRYTIREDWDEEKLGKAVFTAFFLVRSLVGIDVPMSCSTPFLFCAEPLPFADWDMIKAFAMSAAESYVLFGAVAGTMDLLLRNSMIRPFK